MLETVREFVAERLAARPDADQVGRRHAGFYRALAEQADRPLRGTGRGEWLERLDAEAGNLAAVMRWYLARDPGPLPHLFRVLWLFWLQRDLEGQARSWAEQFRHAAGPLDPQARAELALVDSVIAAHTGDDTAALAARQRLAPLQFPVAPYRSARARAALVAHAGSSVARAATKTGQVRGECPAGQPLDLRRCRALRLCGLWLAGSGAARRYGTGDEFMDVLPELCGLLVGDEVTCV